MRRRLIASAATGAVLLAIAVLGQPAPAIFVGLVAVAGFAVAALVLLARGRGGDARLHAAKAALYALVLGGGLTSGLAYDRRSKAQAEALVSALDRYVERHDAYPDSLDALAPVFVPHAPRPSAGPLGPTSFVYARSEDGYVIGYRSLGVVANLYSSSERRWRVRD